MREQLNSLLRSLGEAATAVQDRRHQRSDWRLQAVMERPLETTWQHVTGEIPSLEP